MLTYFPNIGVALHGRFGFEVGDSIASQKWLGVFHGNVDKLQITIGGVASTVDFELADAAPAVPALPPDSVPLFADSAAISGGSYRRDSIVRGVALVEFYPGTSQASRAAAIGAVGGTVIGGRPIVAGDGFYYVRIPGNGTAAALFASLSVLDTMPQVQIAAPVDLELDKDGAYLKPRDGHPDYKTWTLDSSRKTGLNWGLERVRAPLAWGCSTGSVTTTVGVLDEGVDTMVVEHLGPSPLMTDLSRNTQYLNAFFYVKNDGDTVRSIDPHGREVASVLAARGNDGVGMTGMMWNAALMMADLRSIPGRPNSAVPQFVGSRPVSDLAVMQAHIVQLALAGANIINLSRSQYWGNGAGGALPVPSHSDPWAELQAKNQGRTVAGALDRLETQGLHPLMVIAAGNWDRDAYWGGYTLAKLDRPDQVIVVAASDSADHRAILPLSQASNFGTLVDVYAPGKDVGVLSAIGKGDSIVAQGGTSLAAPLVAGIAGLLKTINPALTSLQLKNAILVGAQQRGVQVADGKYLVDAYNSLKTTSVTGGPLCGDQPVWIANRQILVQRSPGASPEVLGTTDGAAWDLDVIHGGHNISYTTLSGSHNLRYTTAGWVQGDPVDDDLFAGGAFMSSHGQSHDGEMLVSGGFSLRDIGPDSERVTISIRDSVDDIDQTVADYAVGPYGPRTEFGDSLPARYVRQVSIAFARLGDSALVAVSRVKSSYRDSTFTCFDDRFIPLTCHAAQYFWRPDTTFLYSVNTVRIPGVVPTLHLLRMLPDTLIYTMAFDEDGQHAVVAWGAERDTVVNGEDTRIQSWCSLQSLSKRLTGTTSLSIPDLEACPAYTGVSGVGGFSPLRVQPRRPLSPSAARRAGKSAIAATSGSRRLTTSRTPAKQIVVPRRGVQSLIKPRAP